MKQTRTFLVAVLALVVLGACGNNAGDDKASDSKTSAPPSATATPTPTATTTAPSTTPTTTPAPSPTKSSTPPKKTYPELAGDWANKDVGWTLHLKADGTYKEDFEGQSDIGGGTYELKGSKIVLHGEPSTSVGSYDGKVMKFDDVVMKRK